MTHASRRRSNPFRYGEVATGPFFTGRATELHELVADLRGGQNVAIISPRRFGKTSLVWQAMASLRQEQVLVAYVDLFRTPTKERLADHLATAIYAGLVAPVERAWHRAIDLFQTLPLRPKVSVGQDGSPSIEFTPGVPERDIDATLEGLLTLPGTIAEQRKRRVVLILDEFQEVVTLDPHLPAIMRSIFQFQIEVAHVFLGSKRHLMQRIFTDANEPLYHSARMLTLGPIPPSDFAPFIRERFASTSTPIEDAAVERILALGEGHPHDTQRLCAAAWSLVHEQALNVTSVLIHQAVDQVLREDDARYAEVWESLTANQRALLAALAAEPGSPYAEAYRRRHQLGAVSSVARAAAALSERGLIERLRQEGFRVPEVFLRAWVARLATPRTFRPTT